MKQVITAKTFGCIPPPSKRASFALLALLTWAPSTMSAASPSRVARPRTSTSYKTAHTRYFVLSSGRRRNLPAVFAERLGASYKTLWTKHRQNRQHLAAGYTKRRYKGLDKAPKYTSPTVTYNYPRDYSWRQGRLVSVNTLSGRVVVGYDGYNKHVELIQQGGQLGEAKLWYDKPSRRFYLLVTIEVEVADPKPEPHRTVVGVDVGQRYLAVAATTTNKSAFYSGKSVKQTAAKYLRIRQGLQRKDTRSATRRLVATSGRERRFKLNVNHSIASSIVDAYPGSIIGIEELPGIRERTDRRHSEKASGKQRLANQHKSSWSFAELHRLLSYKAVLSGSMVVKVDDDYTSMSCPQCNYTSADNRPHKGLMFECVRCGYKLHADLVGARSTRDETASHPAGLDEHG